MPVYDFKCAACSQVTEEILLGDEAAPTECPECGGELSRVFTGRLATQFNGWGFSKTDSWVPDRQGRNDFKTVKNKAAELFD